MDTTNRKMICRRKNLIIFIGNLQSGGAERVVSEISAFYADWFDKVTILTFYDAPVFYNIDQRINVECIEKKTGTKSRLKNALWLRRYVKAKKPDVFLSFLMPYNMLSIVSLAFLKVNLIVCERQDPSNIKSSFFRALRNFLYHFCSRIEVQTNSGKEYFSRKLQKKIFIIPNPNHISIEEREKSLATPKENLVVTVGRLIPLKNHIMLIKAFNRVHNTHPEFKLKIYGDGEMYDSLKKEIESLGLNNTVTLCGRSNDIVTSISPARIFVLTSNVEGMPNALMEAMALGIPSISTNVSGVKDIIEDGVNGFIISAGDENALVEKLLKIIESDNLQKSFSKRTKVIMEKFDKKVIFQQWLDLITIDN